jgi:hypothetical protein
MAGGSTTLISEVGINMASFYCDYNSGSDSDPGTSTQPFKTVGQAITTINSQSGGSLQKTFIINVKGGMTYIESGDGLVQMTTTGTNDHVIIRSWDRFTYGVPKIRKTGGANTWTLDANYSNATGGSLTVQGLDFYKYEMGNGGTALDQSIEDSVVMQINVSSSAGSVQNIVRQCTIDGSTTHGIQINSGVNLDGVCVYNSQMTNCTNYGLYVDPGATGTLSHQYNNYYNNAFGAINIATDATEIKTDPKYTDRTNGDYSLQSDSQSIDAGGTGATHKTSEGIRGITRLTPDIGAYEYYPTVYRVRPAGGVGYYTTIQLALDAVYTQNSTRAFFDEQLVEVESGTYGGIQPNSNLNPTSTNRLIIRSKAGSIPVIDGSITSTRSIVLDSINYVTIDGFEIENFV